MARDPDIETTVVQGDEERRGIQTTSAASRGRLRLRRLRRRNDRGGGAARTAHRWLPSAAGCEVARTSTSFTLPPPPRAKAEDED